MRERERETGDFRTPGSTELLNGQAIWMVKSCNGGRTPSKISGTPELFNQLKKSERSLNKRKRAGRKKRMTEMMLHYKHYNNRREKWAERANESEGGFLHWVSSVVRCIRCKWCFYRLQ